MKKIKVKKGKGKTKHICTLSNISCPASDTCFVGELTFGCCGADLVVFSGPAQKLYFCFCAKLYLCPFARFVFVSYF